MLKPNSCSPCSLYQISDGFMQSEGEGTNGVVVVGEYGGYNEYLDALPLRPNASAGSMFQTAVKMVGEEMGLPVSRKQFLLYNMVNCSPKPGMMDNPKLEQDAVACCAGNVERVVGGFRTNKIKTILALGDIPLRYLTGVSGDAKEKQSISHLRGFVYETKYGYLVPSFNPAFIRRGNGHLTPLLTEDIKKALNVARGVDTNFPSHKEYQPPKYQTNPGLDEAWSFYNQVKDNSRKTLAYDIETVETGAIDEDERDDLVDANIVMVQFSIGKGSGIALPYTPNYAPIIVALFLLPNPKANHNTWNFDNPRLKAKGITINGKIHDTMWMFKHWHPRLPRGLQSVASLFGFPFPWKHLYGSNLQWYGCADVDAVQWIIHSLPQLMQKRGVWRGYVEHVYNVHPILERATEKGIPVDEEKRTKVEEDFKSRRQIVHKNLQQIIPDDIRNIRPKRKDKVTGELDYGYIREPKIVGEEFERYNRISGRLSAEGRKVVSFEEYLYKKHNLCYGEFEGLVENTGPRVKASRWCIVEDFKASSTQLIRYLKWRQDEIKKEIDGLIDRRRSEFGGRNTELTERIRTLEELRDDYTIPVSLKTKKDTTNRKELEEMYLNTGDKVLEMVQEIRSYDTNLNNFIPNWKPSKDGRVHPAYGFVPPQGQINSWRPNAQNVSKHTEFGNEFRGMIEAPKGYCFVEADKKSFHVATMGYCANDRDYIRFSQIDPHSILGSYIDPSVLGGSISLKWSDNDIKNAASEFKKKCKTHKAKDPTHNVDVRQELAKPTVLGNQLELGAKKLQRQNRRFIHSIKEAERLQAIIGDLFPKEALYRRQIKEQAHIQRWLMNEFGRIQYFYDVFVFNFSKKTGTWHKKDGEGARHPIAFEVQGSAFGMITEELLELERLGVCEEHNFITTIHDSLMFMPEVGKRDRCMEVVNEVMNRPCRKLVNAATGVEGLKVGVEFAVGLNWKGWDKDSNSEGMKEAKI